MASLRYAQVRGSVIRLTRLSPDGSYAAGPRSTLVSRNVAKVTINEATQSRPGLEVRGDSDGELHLYAPSTDEAVHYTSDIDFTLTDPDALEITTGQSVITDSNGDIIGFRAAARKDPVTFAMEIWSRLSTPINGYGYGYTLIPRLHGGTLSGLSVEDGNAITFSVKGAATFRGSRWGRGPYRLYSPPGTTGEGWDSTPWDITPWDSAVWGSSPNCGTVSTATAQRLPVEVTSDDLYLNLLTQGSPHATNGAQALSPVTV